MAQERCRAALLLRNVDPLTLNGREELDSMTGGGRPPREPVKVCTFEDTMAAAAVVDAATAEDAMGVLAVVVDAAPAPKASLKASAAAWPVASASCISDMN